MKLRTDMNEKLIDYLYDVYRKENVYFAKNIFLSNFHQYETEEGNALVDFLKKYIEKKVSRLSMFFSSHKDEIGENEKIKDIINAFKRLAEAVDDLMGDYRLENFEKYDEETSIEEGQYISSREYAHGLIYKLSHQEHEMEDIFTAPQEIFTISESFLKEAYTKYATDEITEEGFKQVLELIRLVKEKNSLNKIFGENWGDVDFEDLIYALYDFHRKNKAFKVNVTPTLESIVALNGYINKMKARCAEVASLDFSQYRPELITQKRILEEINKIKFCRNLLEFYRTGIMVESDSLIDFFLDDESEVVQDFINLYGEDFNLEDFKNKQGNFICDFDNMPVSNPDRIVATKQIVQGDSLICGMLLSQDNMFEPESAYYLLHINIRDFNKSTCTYEIQLSILPEGQIEHRIQLIRLDNWESVQPHKNVSKKLQTTTHIHLYNIFDLLRGKINGNYDITFNIEDKTTDFEASLQVFLQVVGVDAGLKKEIVEKISRVRELLVEDSKIVE